MDSPPSTLLELIGIELEETCQRSVIHRQRVPVRKIFDSLGPYYVRRAYRMTEEEFYNLHRVLFPYLGFNQHRKIHIATAKGIVTSQRIGARNGRISSTAILSCAIRYFAGGSVYDIACAHGVSVRSVHNAVLKVVHAVNICPQMSISIPSDHGEQRQLAAGFQAKSAAGFDNCLGAVDGFLVWIEKPSIHEACELSKCSGPMKFMCGRKKKFGLNMMGTVDYLGRFIDVSICHPGATSDYLAFETSDLKYILEKPGFLAPGLVLFGDNAYPNTPYLVTPYKGTVGRQEDRDNYNFYHSQLRIQVECAFGMLVHRWGMLRRPIPQSFGIMGACDTTLALCRLHNYCIDQRVDTELPILALDTANIDAECSNTGFMVNFDPETQTGADAHNRGIQRPSALLDAGDHFDDYSVELRKQDLRRRKRRRVDGAPVILPQTILYESVLNQGLERPTPRGWL